jgi:hypothetical protein
MRYPDGGGLTAARGRPAGSGDRDGSRQHHPDPRSRSRSPAVCMEGQGSGGVLLTIEVFSKTSPLRVPFMGPATPVQFMPRDA